MCNFVSDIYAIVQKECNFIPIYFQIVPSISTIMKDAERLAMLLDFLEENIYSLAQQLGISPTNLYHIKSRRNGFSRQLVSLITLKYRHINPEWLLKGKGEMNLNASKPEDQVKDHVKLVPMTAGDYESGDIILDGNLQQYSIPGITEGFIIRVRDDSMSPLYKAGDFVCARWQNIDDPIVWGKNFIILTGTVGFIRKLMPSASDDSILLVSVNTSFPEFTLPRKSIAKLAKITGVIHLE